MTTYKSKQELEGKTLEKGDVVVLNISGTDYTLEVCKGRGNRVYLYHPMLSNTLFSKLGLNIKNFVKETVGYLFLGDFPYHNSLEDLTKTTLALFAECEKTNKPKGVVDLTIIPEWKVGDIVWFNGWWVINYYAKNADADVGLSCTRDDDRVNRRTFSDNGYYYDEDTARSLLTSKEALLCFGLMPPDDILELSAKIKAENTPEPEVEEELVEVKLTKDQYNKLLTLLNE